MAGNFAWADGFGSTNDDTNGFFGAGGDSVNGETGTCNGVTKARMYTEFGPTLILSQGRDVRGGLATCADDRREEDATIGAPVTMAQQPREVRESGGGQSSGATSPSARKPRRALILGASDHAKSDASVAEDARDERRCWSSILVEHHAHGVPGRCKAAGGGSELLLGGNDRRAMEVDGGRREHSGEQMYANGTPPTRHTHMARRPEGGEGEPSGQTAQSAPQERAAREDRAEIDVEPSSRREPGLRDGIGVGLVAIVALRRAMACALDMAAEAAIWQDIVELMGAVDAMVDVVVRSEAGAGAELTNAVDSMVREQLFSPQHQQAAGYSRVQASLHTSSVTHTSHRPTLKYQ